MSKLKNIDIERKKLNVVHVPPCLLLLLSCLINHVNKYNKHLSRDSIILWIDPCNKYRRGTHLPSLNQWIMGKGVPLTWHSRVVSWLRTTETSLGELVPIMVGGTWTKTFYHENLWLSKKSGEWEKIMISIIFQQDLNVKSKIP